MADEVETEDNGNNGVEALETRDWLDSLDDVIYLRGADRAETILRDLQQHAQKSGVRLPVTSVTPYINTIPPQHAARLSRRPRNRAAHQELDSLERHGHGRARQQAGQTASADIFPPSPRRRRCTKSASTISSAAARRPRRRSGLLPGPRLAGHLRAGVSRRPADAKTSGKFPAGTARAAGCRPIRIRG